MDEKEIEKNEEISVDLRRVFSVLLNKAWLIAIVAVVCAVVTVAGTFFFVTPKYDSTVMFHANNSITSGSSSSVTSSDITASRNLVKSYIIILNTNETIKEVVEYAGIDRSLAAVKGMISATAVDSTELFKVVVTSEDPLEAEKIASAIAHVLPKRIDKIIEGASAAIVDSPIVPTSPSSPNYVTNTVIGFLAGMLLVCLAIVLREIFDVLIHTEGDISQIAGENTVLTAVPDMEEPKTESFYGKFRNSTEKRQRPGSKTNLIGGNISFAASEAYKLLRTKLQFSFADNNRCRVIGISSALSGEGKSLTAVNLSYSLSQLGKRVLLVDCDMRNPSVAEKLSIKKAPGLSEYLSGQATEDKLLQYCGIKEDERAFHVIAAGSVPPNPMELLSSKKMEKALEKLRENYDYVILDLPPVNEVGDALATVHMTDGILLVVRQNHCNRTALTNALRQFNFVNARILGTVFNGTSEEGAGYGDKKYRSYYK